MQEFTGTHRKCSPSGDKASKMSFLDTSGKVMHFDAFSFFSAVRAWAIFHKVSLGLTTDHQLLMGLARRVLNFCGLGDVEGMKTVGKFAAVLQT